MLASKASTIVGGWMELWALRVNVTQMKIMTEEAQAEHDTRGNFMPSSASSTLQSL